LVDRGLAIEQPDDALQAAVGLLWLCDPGLVQQEADLRAQVLARQE
jgi:hypothetical protein